MIPNGLRGQARLILPTLIYLSLLSPTVTAANECPGNPDAIGTSRVLTVDPTEHSRVGTMQYAETLPLNDHEVVLTFDDGPLAPRTNRVLDTLARECVKATFFIIGSMAKIYPAVVRREYREGHTIGTHTQNHPLNLRLLPLPEVEKEIDDGIGSVASALNDALAVTSFFRFPGLSHPPAVEDYLISHGIMISWPPSGCSSRTGSRPRPGKPSIDEHWQ